MATGQPLRTGSGLAAWAVMHRGVATVKPGDSVHWAAERMRDWNVGALPVCDDDDRVVGIVTDRDIVVLAVANDFAPTETAIEELALHPAHTVDVNTDLDDALALMTRYRIRRLPVTEHGRVVGMISEGDIARNLPADAVGSFLTALYATNEC